MSREAWLHQAAELMRPVLAAHDANLPDKLQISVGFPKSSKTAAGRAIGQCWSQEATADGTVHVFVCPTLGASTLMLLAVLLHELVHAAVGVQFKHRGPFATVMRALGYQGRLTVVAEELLSDELKATLTGLIDQLGAYEHAAIKAQPRPVREKSLNVVLRSVNDEEFKIGMKRDLYESKGAPKDPWGAEMVPVRGAGRQEDAVAA